MFSFVISRLARIEQAVVSSAVGIGFGIAPCSPAVELLSKAAGELGGWEIGQAAREIDATLPVVYMSGSHAEEWASKGVPNSLMLTKPLLPLSWSLPYLNFSTRVLRQPGQTDEADRLISRVCRSSIFDRRSDLGGRQRIAWFARRAIAKKRNTGCNPPSNLVAIDRRTANATVFGSGRRFGSTVQTLTEQPENCSAAPDDAIDQ